MLDHAQLFTEARTHYGWLPDPVHDATLQQIRKMQDFARLVRSGTLKQRRAALAAHLSDVESRIKDLKVTVALLKKKIARYDA